jgi:lipoate-protein ligase A
MAADEWLLDNAQVPTLRLYSWKGPWLSLGYAQRLNWLDPVLLEGLGVGVVRRPSGGRAVLHHREITYAMVLPQGAGSLQEVYRQLTGLWHETLNQLGIDVASACAPARARQPRAPSCYEASLAGELQLGGRKLLGSAQLRRGERLLQHGSLPLAVDAELFSTIFPGSELPAQLGPMTIDELIGAFPEPLEKQGWKEEELASLEERLRCVC